MDKVEKREQTREITVRGLKIGGQAQVTVQSMCNTKTWDVEATLKQIRAFQAAGCDIVRLAIPDVRSAEALSAIREGTDMPLVADIHFDYKLALMAASTRATSEEKSMLKLWRKPAGQEISPFASG